MHSQVYLSLLLLTSLFGHSLYPHGRGRVKKVSNKIKKKKKKKSNSVMLL